MTARALEAAPCPSLSLIKEEAATKRAVFRKKVLGFPFTLLIIVLSLLSCEGNVLSPRDLSRQALFIESSVKAGGVVFPGDEVDLSFIYPEEETAPSLMKLALRNSSGEELLRYEVEEPVTGMDLQPISFAALQEGLYFIRVSLFDDEEMVLKEREIPLFLSSNRPVIEQLETYPPSSLKPGAEGVIIPRITSTGETWLRWSRGDTVLDEGRITDYSEGFVWEAPKAEGVYSIVLEAFPFPPPEELPRGYDFTSADSAVLQFYVQRGAPDDPSEFGPETSYLHLLHLRGSVEDSGSETAEFRFDGEPAPAVQGNLFGYRFSPGKAVLGETLLFPFGSKGLESFSLSLILQVEPVQEADGSFAAGQLIRVLDGDDTVRAELSFSESGEPVLHMDGLKYESEASEIDIFRLSELTVSFSRSFETGIVKWYADGVLLKTEEIPYSPRIPTDGGRTIIGGARSFHGILYELGVYVRNASGEASPDTGVFKRNAVRRLGADTVYFADGFENPSRLSDGRVLSKQVNSIAARLEEEWQELEFHLPVSGEYEEAGVGLVDSRGQILSFPLIEAVEGNEVHFFLRKTGKRVEVYSRLPDGTKLVLAEAERDIAGSGPLLLEVSKPRFEKQTLILNSILITRSAREFVNKKD